MVICRRAYLFLLLSVLLNLELEQALEDSNCIRLSKATQARCTSVVVGPRCTITFNAAAPVQGTVRNLPAVLNEGVRRACLCIPFFEEGGYLGDASLFLQNWPCALQQATSKAAGTNVCFANASWTRQRLANGMPGAARFEQVDEPVKMRIPHVESPGSPTQQRFQCS
jgi:hypothetical protein